MMKSAKHRIVAVDKTKFGISIELVTRVIRSFCLIAFAIKTLVVEASMAIEKPGDEWLERFKQMGVRCYYPGR